MIPPHPDPQQFASSGPKQRCRLSSQINGQLDQSLVGIFLCSDIRTQKEAYRFRLRISERIVFKRMKMTSANPVVMAAIA